MGPLQPSYPIVAVHPCEGSFAADQAPSCVHQLVLSVFSSLSRLVLLAVIVPTISYSTCGMTFLLLFCGFWALCLYFKTF